MMILEIQRLRAFAVLTVMFFHISVNFPDLFSSPWGGTLGVDLFFVISGYVITGSLFRNNLHASLVSGGINWTSVLKAFYVRRIFRIVPLAAACCVYYLCRSQLFPPPPPFAESYSHVPDVLVSILTLRFNYDLVSNKTWDFASFFWSLMVEEHFYLFIPLVLLKLKSHASRLAACILGILFTLWVSQPLTGALSDPELVSRAWGYYTHNRVDALFLGVALWILQQTRPFGSFLKQVDRIPSALLQIWCWIALTWITFFPLFRQTKWSQTSLPYALLLCGSLVLLASLPLKKPVVLRMPTRIERFLEYLGSRSYGIYIWHIPIIFETAVLARTYPWIANNILVLVSGICVCVIVLAEVAYRWIERPFLEKGLALSAFFLQRSRR